MKTPHNEHEAVERLLAIDWTRTRSGRKSQVGLVREYLRRSALWVKHLHATEHWPFSDLAGLIAPEVRADQGVVDQLEAALAPFSLWPTIKKTCIWSLHWAALRRERLEVIAQYNLPEPFEPLIRLYERGGRFYTEHGFINVDMVGIPAKVRGWHAYDSTAPFVALDDEALDGLDATSDSA